MKKIVFVLLVSGAVACTSGGNPNNFTVSGKIANAGSKAILLKQVAYDNSLPKVIDSGKLTADGSYALKANTTEQNLYLLIIDKKTAAIFVNDNSDIKISTDLNQNFRTPYISNSAATKDMYGFLNQFMAKDSSLSGLYQKIQTLYTENPNDSTILILQNQGTHEMSAMKDFIKNYILKSTNPGAVFYAFNIAGSRNLFDINELDSLVRQSSDRFKEHAGFAAFKTMVIQQIAGASNPSGTTADYPLLNQQAPELSMSDMNGQSLSISSFKGKYLLVDFWASWCKPCRAENPNVVAAYNKYKGKNFTILGVSLDKDKSAWVNAVKKDNLSWPQMSDLKEWESSAVQTYHVSAIPFNVLIDPSGKIIAQSLRGDALEQKLAEVLK